MSESIIKGVEMGEICQNLSLKSQREITVEIGMTLQGVLIPGPLCTLGAMCLSACRISQMQAILDNSGKLQLNCVFMKPYKLYLCN